MNFGALGRRSTPISTRALKRLKITRRAFHVRKLHGLRIIAGELARRRVPVR